MLKNSINVLSNMQALHLDITLWSARRKLTPEDFGQNKDTLPPEELASLGSKRIAPPEKLRIFSALKARAISLLDKHGIRFLGGWFIPETAHTEVEVGLGKLRDEFQQQKALFLAEYQTIIADWLDSHEGWRQILENSVVSPNYVAQRLQFAWSSYRLSTVQTADFSDKVGKLADTLFDDVAHTANEIWRDSISGRENITHKTLSPFRTLKNKLDGLAFVEPHIAPVAALIHTALSRMPSRGVIDGADLAMMQGLTCLLRDKGALISHAKMVMEGHDAGVLLGSLSEHDPAPMPEAAKAKPYIKNMGLW